MKQAFLLFFVLLVFQFTACKEEPLVFKAINHLERFSTIKEQKFQLDTTSFSVIEGQNGTVIWFERDALDINSNERITMVLKEFYDFEELILNNINTITQNGQLLESSGVIYLDFMSEGSSVPLKEGKRIGIRFPDNRLNGNNLYTASVDSLNQFKWNEEEIYVGIMQYDEEYAIDLLKIIPQDSLEYFTGIIPEMIPGQSDTIFLGNNGSIYINQLKWINIDQVILPDRKISFELVTSDNLENINVYFLYKNLNSFISEYRTIDSLMFNEIPIKDTTHLVAISRLDDKFFADKIYLSEITEKSIKLNFKEVDSIELQKILSP